MKKIYLTILSIALFFVSVKSQTVIAPTDEIVLPQYAYYGGTAASRLHYVCRLKLTGLNPSATYIYATGMSSDGTKTGQTPGYMILIKNSILGMSSFKAINASEIADGEINYGSSSRNGRFDTNSSGEYEGWFSCVPIGTAGQQ